MRLNNDLELINYRRLKACYVYITLRLSHEKETRHSSFLCNE